MNKQLKLSIWICCVLALITVSVAAMLSAISRKNQKDYEVFLSTNRSFYENSFLNNADIGQKTPEEVFTQLKESLDGQTLKFVLAGKEQEYTYADLGIDYSELEKYITDSYNNQSISKDEYLKGASPRNYSFDLQQLVICSKLNMTKLEKALGIGSVSSQDAHVSVDVDTGEAVLVSEVYGNYLDKDKVTAKAVEAITANKSSVELSSEDYVMPSVIEGDEQLARELEKAELLMDKEITVKVCGYKEVLKGETLWNLVSYDGGFTVEEAEVKKYVTSLKSKYDTYKTRRQFTTSLGETITTEEGNYGWAIDSKDTIPILADAILSDRNKLTVEVDYSVYGQNDPFHEIEGSYVEISIASQHIWMYIDGVCVLSDDCCTGEELLTEDTQTNRGVFRLTYMQLNAVLRGDDYEEPVTYWMPFDGGIGLHDATWRTDEEFGGTNYLGNGSHGCVNLKLATAEFIYNNITMNMPIIVW